MRIYAFEHGDGKNKKLLGGKGAGLCEMTRLDLPVPLGFVITTEVCLEYYEHGKKLPLGLMDEVKRNILGIEKKTGKKFGGAENPLLVSVRSGAAMSMPGMMDTILNLGLNEATLKGVIEQTKNERFAWDSYRRFVQLFSEIAMGAQEESFSKKFAEIKGKYSAHLDTDLDAKALKEITEDFKKICKHETGKDFPDEPFEQLETAISAVFESWMGKRAVDYRKYNKITPEMANGTAVNIQTMVFGNMGNDSATGVAFTRDPSSGENIFFGEYLTNAQGEDVVAGIRTPKPIVEMENEFPETYKELCEVRKKLECHYKEVQDFEFTMEKGILWVLQTRNGKMTASSRLKTSIDMLNEALLTKKEAILRIDPAQIEQLLHKQIDPQANAKSVAKGLAASPGAATGKVVFSADEAEELGEKGEIIILVREETKPDDIHGFISAQGVLTSKGGKTSHAAVVARSMGKPCVSGCNAIKIDDRKKIFKVDDKIIKELETITIDGTSGEVFIGKVPLIEPEITEDFKQVLKWADEIRILEVRANADSPNDAKIARDFGAEGIGLCRTERMFNDVERLPIFQKMILSDSDEERKSAIEKLMPLQKKDFMEIFEVMNGLPVTIRLLDPPLHEFLPSIEQLMNDINELKERGENIKEKKNVLRKVKTLYEVNPMLGHRGVRLGITIPDLYDMQVYAIIEAACEVKKKNIDVKTEIMVPQVSISNELKFVKKRVDLIAHEVFKKHKQKIDYKFGTMMEVVRGCLTAEQLAEFAEFFSFGTNDLTQGTFSFSREDAENKFLPKYMEEVILKNNPFETLDIDGVGRLMQIAIKDGKKRRPDLKIGICGEHGGDPASVRFCSKIGLNYVSCSGYRVPVARLAAAQEVAQKQ
ncbi:MAG: pyruvate, phosphate dikinase [Candidatus Bathyarchaeia archaeon]|jgi:pyruvate,orthophosphate dikinase|nr:pyruvate, phosphate dikinase [Candidatus Bathyarchaeota archaeon]